MPNHGPEYYNLINNKQVKPFIPNQCVPASPEEAIKEIESLIKNYKNGNGMYWAIVSNEKLIGTCGLHSWNIIVNSIELSYEIHPDFWGQGIATNAVKHAILYAKKYLNIATIKCYTLTDNIPSQKVAEKAGLTKIKVCYNDCIFNGKVVDRVLHTINLK